MSDIEFFQVIQSGDVEKAAQYIDSVDVDTQDDHGWTALCWAAGRGDTKMVRLLLDRGADLLRIGKDQRTPYAIALAAGREEVAKLLREEEAKLDLAESPNDDSHPYCKAVLIGDLRQYAKWSERSIESHAGRSEDLTDDERRIESTGFVDEDIVFIHRDYTVTQSIWPDENVVFAEVTPEWRIFCEQQMNFHVPDSLDLIVPDHVLQEALRESRSKPDDG